MEPTIEDERAGRPNGFDIVQGTTTTGLRTSQHTRVGEVVVPRIEPQQVWIALDPEIAEVIRGIAREQRNLQTDVENIRKETFEVRVLVKTQESRLNRVFQRIGDVIEDQWILRAEINELKKLQEAAGSQDQRPVSQQMPIKSEAASPEPFVVTVSGTESGIESLYASKEEEKPRQGNQSTHGSKREVIGQPEITDQTLVTPGEAWIRNWNGQRRYRLGTEEVLER